MTKEFKSWNSYSDFVHSVKTRTRYLHDKEIDEFLETLYKTCEEHTETLKKNSTLYRAQIGNNWRTTYQGGEPIEIEVPYSVGRMKPLHDRAPEGRGNPKGIPYLYLATKHETALTEVRPWIGSLISLAHFVTQRDLKIINFAGDRNTLIYLKEPSSTEKAESVWEDIDRAFSTPVTPSDDVADYVSTQIIAEFFKSKGFDGIAYRSSIDNSTDLNKGHNIALFDIDAVKQLTPSCLFKVNLIDFKFSEV